MYMYTLPSIYHILVITLTIRFPIIWDMDCLVIRCAVLCCAVLYGAVLCCAVLRCAELRCSVLRGAVLSSAHRLVSISQPGLRDSWCKGTQSQHSVAQLQSGLCHKVQHLDIFLGNKHWGIGNRPQAIGSPSRINERNVFAKSIAHERI